MITKSLPSLFTLANLSLGMVAILLIFEQHPNLAAMMIIFAMLTDGIDGRLARALNVQSEFGKELDSLSDIISFGVAPAFIMYVLAFHELGFLGWFITALFPICGALRLARFNVTASPPGQFIGLPIPAAGGGLATLALFHQEIGLIVLSVSSVLLSFLMISFVKYPDFKKVRFSKSMLITSALIALIMIGWFIVKPESVSTMSRLIFVPLVLYALYGLKKNISLLVRISLRKRSRQSDIPAEEAAEIESATH